MVLSKVLSVQVMGLHGLSNSFKKRNMYSSKHKVTKIKRKQKHKNKIKFRKEGYIDPVDLLLMSEQHLKKRKSDPFANLALSGKKKRKLLKAVKFNEKERFEKELAAAKAEAEAYERKKNLRMKKQSRSREVEMTEIPSTSGSGATMDALNQHDELPETEDTAMEEEVVEVKDNDTEQQ